MDDFWSHVERGDCWLWTGGTVGHPQYGNFRGRRAHRVSWELHHGPIPPGLCVLHHCDTPLCVRPDHLWLGTRADNNRDRSSKHRDAERRGASNPNAKLTPEQVAAIRAEYAAGARQVRLAGDYGVTQPHISRIVRGINYA